jgi:UDP-N-acetylglucosamine--N-acetylmuramyl-(pentapeptide) pyrophosphoryl-undecaprenol N-acetylglucosamine transferase
MTDGDKGGMSVLLVAAAGGHLKQLRDLLPRFSGGDADCTWVTFDNAQSRSLLAGQNVIYAAYPDPRDIADTLRHTALAFRVLRRRRFDLVVSTGSSIAVAFLPLAARFGASAHYIESATRVSGPSMSGRMLRWVPGVHVYSQYRAWARAPWLYRGSVFDGFVVEERPPAPVRRIVVSVGSSVYGFRRLIESVLRIAPPDADVLWQTGETDLRGLDIDARPSMPADELEAALGEADVVICHAGTGSALSALEAGLSPILVPRRAAFGEHVDDHQEQIAVQLAERGLAIVRDADELGPQDLVAAAGLRVVRAADPPPFRLVGAEGDGSHTAAAGH